MRDFLFWIDLARTLVDEPRHFVHGFRKVSTLPPILSAIFPHRDCLAPQCMQRSSGILPAGGRFADSFERRQHHVGDQLVDVQGEVGRFARLNPYLVSMHAAIHISRMYILGGLYILGGVFPQSVHFTPHSVRIVSAAKSPKVRDLSVPRKVCGQFRTSTTPCWRPTC